MNNRQRRGQPIHRSLVRTPLLLGTEFEVLAVEAAVVWLVVVVAGVSVLTLVVGVAFWCVVHPVMVWISKRDAQVLRVYLRSLSHSSYYPAHALQRVPTPPYNNRLPGGRR
jgi:type IV secretory pathway TrbD component